jgi:hypothetical protein
MGPNTVLLGRRTAIRMGWTRWPHRISFPESTALSEALRLTVAYHVEKLIADRPTLTAPVFNSAASVIFQRCEPPPETVRRQRMERRSPLHHHSIIDVQFVSHFEKS